MMVSTMDINSRSLETLRYAELQQLAKQLGIRANLKADKLRAALREHREAHLVASSSYQSLHDSTKSEESQIMETHMNTSTEHKSFNCDNEDDVSENSHFTEDEMEKLTPCELPDSINTFENEVNKTSLLNLSNNCATRDLEITVRRSMTTRRTTFDANEVAHLSAKSSQQTSKPVTLTKSIRKPINWAAIHQRQFKKMDSLVVYLEKKQDRHHYLQTPPKRALTLAALGPRLKNTEQVLNNKSNTFVPNVFSTTQINTNFATMYMTPSVTTTVSLSRNAATTGNKSVNGKVLSKENKPRTPGNLITNTSFSSSIMSAKKSVFDLKASLAKPLNYVPHVGKLKPFATARVDLKQATKAKSSRDERRQQMKTTRQVQRQALHLSRRQ